MNTSLWNSRGSVFLSRAHVSHEFAVLILKRFRGKFLSLLNKYNDGLMVKLDDLLACFSQVQLRIHPSQLRGPFLPSNSHLRAPAEVLGWILRHPHYSSFILKSV